MATEPWHIAGRLFKAADLYELQLAAEHIPEVENGLPGGLSRDFIGSGFRRGHELQKREKHYAAVLIPGGVLYAARISSYRMLPAREVRATSLVQQVMVEAKQVADEGPWHLSLGLQISEACREQKRLL
ncbi:hypothetical protein CYMTET_34154 [Cymbomonas tetramitiformis]|uniref:Uncharacterized protein n=1 Tax=Cymbomonas tetramitiformis TaxID=36881 RepID=A0AAE0FBR4_9CHLO|nr:hypothetical protein CYMTET_34154 [Cymbomonas tetramitiformis]